jgi:hypothetical protein
MSFLVEKVWIELVADTDHEISLEDLSQFVGKAQLVVGDDPHEDVYIRVSQYGLELEAEPEFPIVVNARGLLEIKV